MKGCREGMVRNTFSWLPSPPPEQQQMTIASKPGHIDILTKAGSSQAAESLLPNKHSRGNGAGVGVGAALTKSSLAAPPAPLPWASYNAEGMTTADTLQGSDGCTSLGAKGIKSSPSSHKKIYVYYKSKKNRHANPSQKTHLLGDDEAGIKLLLTCRQAREVRTWMS